MIPHERSLVKKFEGQPFALIGVNTDKDRESVKQQSKEKEVTWRSFWVGGTDSPICQQWEVEVFPTIYIIDREGIIRGVANSSKDMEMLVERLLKEAEPKNVVPPKPKS
jgi:hypothetical protein